MDDLHQLPCLPADLFFIVITRFLDPIDIVRCRRVSKQWFAAFTKPEFLKKALVWHHGHAREVAQLKETGELDASLDTTAAGAYTAARWMHIFDQVAARYHSLRTGKPQSIIEIQPFQHRRSQVMMPIDSRGSSLNWRYDLQWTYDSGLLVYADPESKSYVVLDIAQNVKSIVPFEWTKSIVRKIRLKCNVLIIEWIGTAAWVELNSQQAVYDYFVTAYDILKCPYSHGWAVTLRSEWRLDPAGFPVDLYDRHISTHTSTHYAVYNLRLPSRNRRVDKPFESLLVWDIQQPSTYRPSDYTSEDIDPNVGPTLIKNLDSVSLDFYDISQRKMLLFRCLELDRDASGMIYFTEDSNMFLDTCGDVPRADVPLCYGERIVGIPIRGEGPRWESEKTIWSCSARPGSLHRTRAKSAICWREKWLPQSTRTKEFGDEAARLTFSLVQSGTARTDCTIWISGQDWAGETWTSRLDEDESAGSRMRDAIIYGEERWIVGQRGGCIEILCFDKARGRTRRRDEARSRRGQPHGIRYKKLFMYPSWN